MRPACAHCQLEPTMSGSPDRIPPAALESDAFDKEGFLRKLDDWNPGVAVQLADHIKLDLTEDHWEIIHLVRAFYQRTDVVPAMRPLVKLVRAELGAGKGSSLHLNLLFPDGAAKNLARVAGLPKPTNCL